MRDVKPLGLCLKRIARAALIAWLLFAPPAWADTPVSGTIAVDTTWDLAGSPYIVTGHVTVQGTDGTDGITTLTVEPGVQVRFNSYVQLAVGGGSGDPGALVAQGTAAAPIVFTSSNASPTPGLWYGIHFYDTSDDATSLLEHCSVEYAGYGNSGAVRVNSSAPTLTACRFADNAATDLHYTGTVGGTVSGCTFNHGLNHAGSGRVAFDGNTFNWDNAYPVRVPADNAGSLVATAAFTGLDADSALAVTGTNLTLDATWKNTIPYALTNYLRIQGTDGADGVTTLTLEPGVEVRFGAGVYMCAGYTSGDPGALVARGTAAAPIVFTSSNASPSPGLWYGIHFYNTSDDATSLLEHCTVKYAGFSNTGAVQVNSAAPTLTACRFADNAGSDLHYTGTVGGTVSGCTFNHGLNHAGSGRVAFDGNTFNWDNGYPVRVPADNVGALVATAAFTGLDADSALAVTGHYLTLDSTWNSTIPYALTGYLRIQGTDGADGVTTLILEPGAEVRFGYGVNLYVGYTSGDPGALVARGTAAAPIVFTSSNASPTPGLWYGIHFYNTSDDATSLLEHCTVEYAGFSNTGAVQVISAAPTLTACRFADNAGSDLHYTGTVGGTVSGCTFNHGLNHAGSGRVAFDGNTFNWDNGYPVRVPADNVGALVATAAFTGLDADSALAVTGHYLTLDSTWNSTIPYALTGYLRIQGTDGADGVTTLTLEPGAEVRFGAGVYLNVGYSSGDPGALSAVGTEADPIRFTADSTAPTVGYWGYINFADTADDALSRLEHAIVEYGGYMNSGEVYLGRSKPSIRYCTIRNSSNYGIYAQYSESSGAIIECNNIRDNLYGIYVASGAQPVIGGNNFINNQNYGVFNAGSAQVSAVNNWWGDAGGPNLTGDAVYGNVAYDPWRTQPSDCVTGAPVNDPPLEPRDPSPADGAVGVPFADQSVVLSWTGIDPNPSDVVTYDLLWGTDSANLTAAAQDLGVSSHTMAGIQPATTYYWQIVSRDEHGSQTSGPVWQFTTADPQPDLVIGDLTWTPADNISAGQVITFTATLRNEGPGILTDTVGVVFRFNGQSATTYWVYDDLAPGQTVQLSRDWTAQTGPLTLEVLADSNSAVAENDETNNSRSADLGTIPDTTPPELSSTTPTDGAFMQSVNQIVMYVIDRFGGAVDTATTAATIAVTVDGGQPVAGSVNVSGNQFVFTPDTAPLAEGVYQVSLTAQDTAGNSQACGFGFSVDNQVPAPPVITGGNATSGTIQARPAANRSNKAVITLTGTREDQTAVWVNNAWLVSVGSGPWSCSFGLNQGDNVLEVRSRDAAGNSSEPVYVDIYADSVAPVIGAVSPAAGAFIDSVPAAVTVDYTEDGSGIDAAAATHVLKNGALDPVAGVWSDNSGQLRFVPAAALADDTYTLEVRLADNLSNTSQNLQSVFTVDTTAPPAPQIEPVTSPTHTVTQTIRGQKEAYAAVWLGGQQIVDPTASTDWQHTVTLTSGDNPFGFAARDRAGNVSPEAQVTIVFDDIAPPPVALSADGNRDGTSVALNWSGYNEAAHGDIQSYRVFHETAAFGDVSGLTVRAELPAGTFSHTVTGLTNATPYWFAVVAVDRMGNFNPAVTAVAATPTDGQAPENVTGLSVQSHADRLVFGWTPSADSQGDLAGYRIYFNNPSAPETLAADQTAYEAAGLSAAGAYPFTITAYDANGNESSGIATTGYTWLDNPTGLTAEAFSGYVTLNWNAVSPAAHLKHYAVFASAAGPYTSVAGMTPAVTVSGTSAKVAGLANHQTYHFAVAAVNRSDGMRPDVVTIPAEPAPDEEGPQMSAVQIDGQPLADGQSVTRRAQVTLDADDPAGVSRIEFRLDGGLLNIDYNAPYGLSLDPAPLTDGSHSLEIRAVDTLDNAASLTFTLAVSLEPPAAPSITQPADGLLTNQTDLTVVGQAQKETQVVLYLEGQAVTGAAGVDAQGGFTVPVTLIEGVNHISAAALNRAGAGPQSAVVTVTVDTSMPQPPRQLAAQAIESGTIRLTWQPPAGKLVEGYNLYRAENEFAAIAGAVKVNDQPFNATGYRDLPPADGLYYYRMTSVDAAGNESALSNQVSAQSDGTAPRVTAIEYFPQGNVDPVGGAVAPGRVDLTLVVSEPLMALPFLSITPQGGMPINVVLTQTGEQSYGGSFTIDANTPGGTAYAVFSGRDRVGNRGTEIDSGLSILLDTQGPAIRRIVTTPATPIRNDAQAPVTVTVTIGLDEMVDAGTGPGLDYLLSGAGRSPVNIANLVETAPAAGDAQTWQGSFELPADAGQAEVETLQFSHQSYDSLGNMSQRILAANRFQVYQGELPPLAAPTGLTARALSGGRVELAWNPVEQAVGYRLHRQGPGESEMTVLARIEGTTFLDATDLDGTYTYAVTSLRGENGQEAESDPSAPVSVEADSQAPAVPSNLTLQLIPPGIEAQWDFDGIESVSFRLYRDDVMEISAIDGLSPLDCDFNQNKALDRHPSPTDHSYVVTAVDAAGNESAPSNSAYLNFDLLPVSSISVEQVDTDNPVLTWTHPGGSLAGYDVFMGPEGQSVKVNAAPVADLSMTDTGYAGDVREYRVIAVDANDVQSQARTILLPRVQAAPVTGSRLLRGIMNKLEYTVVNPSDRALDNLQVIARVMDIDHPSASFSLAAGESRTVPVIVAGYADLADAEPLTTTVQMQPDPDETARIVRTGEILVGDGMLTLQVYNEEMIRGGTGKVWFTLENSGQADIEIVTARRQGRSDSDEIGFTLLDADGNTLSTLAFRQALGAAVVTLSGGVTVARIPAGAVFESDPVAIPVPGNAPDELTLRLEIDSIYHHFGQDDELNMRGVTTTRAVQLTETEYTGAITDITPPVTAGIEDVKITGQALMRDSGQPVPNAPVNLVLTLNGFERLIELTTGADGQFTYTFTPLPGEAGTYKAAALHPDLLDRPVQATFTVTRIDIRPANIRVNMPKNYSQTIPIEVTTGQDTQVHNLRLVYDDWDQPADAFAQGVTYTVSDPVPVVEAGGKATIDLTLASDNSASDSGSLVLRLVSDESGVQPWGYVTVKAQFSESQPFLAATPGFVETGVLLGDMVTETVTLENKGLADLENLALSLIGEDYAPVPDWVVLGGDTAAGSLSVGARRDVSVSFAPGAGTAEGFYTFYLRVQADNYPVTDIPLYLSAAPDGIGNALFKVTDIFTGTFDDYNELIQGLPGARITVQNEKNLTIVHEQQTDAYGEALFSNLPAGIYKYRVQAAGHQEKIGRFWIRPGLTASEDVFMEYNLVTVEWEVKETTIQDKYDIVLKVTYETDVPAPVVVCDPPSVVLPDLKAGDVLNGEFTLTNYGLIRADNLEIHLPPEDPYVRYELLADIPESLGAKERITVPYRLTCVQSLNLADEIQSGGGSGGYGACMSTTYSGVSVNGCPFSGSAPHCFSASGGGGGGSGSGGGSVIWGWGYSGSASGGSGSASGGGSSAQSIGSGGVCTPAPGDDDHNSKCGGPGGGGGGGGCKNAKDCRQPVCSSTGSWVNLFMRSYTDEATDLSVKVPGGSIHIQRAYYNEGYKHYADSWHWRHGRELEFEIKVFRTSEGVSSRGGSGGGSSAGSVRSINPSVTTTDGNTVTLKPVKREGITFKPEPNASDIDLAAGQTVVLRPDFGTDRIVYRGDNIWRWEDKYGNWEDYYFDIARLNGVSADQAGPNPRAGYLLAYGDRQGTLAKLMRNSQTHAVEGIADRNDRQVLWFEESVAGNGNTITIIRDLENRQIEYETSLAPLSANPCYILHQVLLHRFKDTEGNETTFSYDPIPYFKYSAATSSTGGAFESARISGSSGGGGGGGAGGIACSPPKRYGLKSVTDADGRTKTITYNSEGGVASVLDNDGRGYFFEYSYDQETREYYAQKRDTNGKVQEIWIDGNSEASRVDLNGRTVKSFEKDGNVYTTIDESGNRTIKAYDEWDNLIQVTYPGGATVKYTYDPGLQKVIKKIDENSVVTTYEYDDAGRLTRRTEAKDTPRQRVTDFGYDTQGNLDTIRRHGDGDTAEALTTMTYDADGNMESLTDPEGRITTFTYDVAGNVLTKTDPRGKTWTYTYDTTGRLKTVTDPLNHATEYFYDPVGNKIRERDPAGKETVYEYDARDNLKKAVNPALEVTLIENTFDGRVLSQTDAEGRKVQYQYDADGRLAKNLDGNANEIALVYGGDTGGCSSCGGNSGSPDQPAKIVFPTFTREIKYDGRGRKYAQRDLLGNDSEQITRFTYDGVGNLTSKTDAEGRVTTYEYDALDRLVKVIDAQGNWTTYTYDNRDNLIALTDAEDHTTRFEYDRNNRLTREIRPMGEETHYDYDGAGNLIEKIDARDQRSEYIYDDAGRLTDIRYYAAGDHATPVKTVTFTYDDAGNLTGYDDGTTSAAYGYDDAYRKVTETVTYPGFTKTNTYTYYKNGLKKSYTGPDNIAYGYLYDANNQLTGVQIPNVGIFTVNDYTWNRPATETLPGGATRRYDYDPLMRVSDITAGDPGGNEQLNYHYAYDKVDNITAKATEHGDYAYQYDDLYRLTDTDNPEQADESFDYDNVGNRLASAKTSGDWSYNANNELEGYDDVTFQYDANGNMTEKNAGGVVTRFFYNLEDRLERVEDGTGNVIATYYYDPFGRRLWKDVGGTRTCFLYSDEGLVGEYDATGNEIKTYGWKPGSTWSTDPLFMKVGGNYYWYHNDHSGTPQMMTTSSGAVVWKAKYSSFGKATIDPSSTVENPLRLPGQYGDDETGLHYNWNRYYNPENGRYFTPDPIGLLRGINQYLYCSNNSISWIDPFGLFKYYGNWGGPDWTGGYKKSWDQLSEYERKHVLAPIDSQDECYMGHDIGYGKCRLKYKNSAYSLCRDIAEGNCFNREDTKLQGCLSALPPDPANWPIPPKNARDYKNAILHQKLAGVAFALQKNNRRINWERNRNNDDPNRPVGAPLISIPF